MANPNTFPSMGEGWMGVLRTLNKLGRTPTFVLPRRGGGILVRALMALHRIRMA